MILTTSVPSTNLDWKYVWGEIQELIVEIKRLNPIGIIDELSDVYTCSMCAITTSTNIPVPIFWMRSAAKWEDRIRFFKCYLNTIGLEYKVEYLRYGANYKRAYKRRKVVDLAIEDQL